MEPEKSVILYTRPGCHLCEHVETLLHRLGFGFRPVDIETDPELEKVYGLRIPVVRLAGSGQELAFPFDAGALSAFLEKKGSG